MKARLYYEMHVTIEPVFGERQLAAKTIAAAHGFSMADLLMQKNRQPTEERSDKDMFITGHAENLNKATERVTNVVREFRSAGFRVWRYKVEDTIIDSRMGDELCLLSSR